MHYEDLIERLKNGTKLPALQDLMNEAVEAIEKSQKELNLCRNELCLKCGNYKERHLGACDGCRWRRTMAEKDHISREAAIEAVCCACSMEGDFHKCVGYPQNSEWCEYMVSLRSIPAADVRPVVRGRWIKYAPHNSDMMTCSECEKYWILDGDQYDYHFCPNCGADMREATP